MLGFAELSTPRMCSFRPDVRRRHSSDRQMPQQPPKKVSSRNRELQSTITQVDATSHDGRPAWLRCSIIRTFEIAWCETRRLHLTWSQRQGQSDATATPCRGQSTRMLREARLLTSVVVKDLHEIMQIISYRRKLLWQGCSNARRHPQQAQNPITAWVPSLGMSAISNAESQLRVSLGHRCPGMNGAIK